MLTRETQPTHDTTTLKQLLKGAYEVSEIESL